MFSFQGIKKVQRTTTFIHALPYHIMVIERVKTVIGNQS